jgi:putative MFS transporter
MPPPLLNDRTSDRISGISSRIERLPFTSWQVKTLVIICALTFFDAFDAMTIAFALPVLIGTWKIKPQYIGLLISAGFLGQMLGAIAFGRVAERIGRLRTVVIASLLFSILSFCCAASWSYASLLVIRLIQGFGLGGEVPVAATYLNEIIGAKTRGKFGLSFMIFSFGIGVAIASAAGYWIVPHFGWRWLFIVGGFPLVIIVYLARVLPESPRWLAGVGREEEAERAMAAIERGVRKALGRDLPAPAKVPVPTAATVTRFAELFGGIYSKRTIMVWVMWFAAYLANYGVNTWLPSLYKSVFKLPLDKSLLYTMGTLGFGIIGSAATILLIDRIGRRLVQSVCFFAGGALFLGLWYMGASTAIQVFVFTTLAWVFFSVTCGVPYVYTPEIYPTRMRALGTSVGTAWLRVAAMVGPLFVGMVVARYGAVSLVFLFYGLIAVIAGIVVLWLGVEPKGKVLEQISP